MDQPASSTDTPVAGLRKTARALLLGDRLDFGPRAGGRLSSAPLAFKVGQDGFVALFRYGVAVLVGLSPLEEDDVIRSFGSGSSASSRHEEESAVIEVAPDKEDQIPPGGPIYLKTLAPERLIVIADALAKSAVLARDEREAAGVFDVMEPSPRILPKRAAAPATGARS